MDASEPSSEPQIAFSVRTRTKTGRTYYSNVYAASLEEAYRRYGSSSFQDAEVDIVVATQDDLERGDRGLSHP